MRQQMWATSIGVIVGMLVLASLTVEGQEVAQGGPAVASDTAALIERIGSGGWDRFSIRVVVRRELVRDGASTGYRPITDEYLYQREKTATGWRTRVQVVAGTAPTIRTRLGEAALASDVGIGAMEDEEDGTAPRFFTRAGVEIRPPTPERRERLAAGAPEGVKGQWLEWAGGLGGVARRTSGQDWVKAFVMGPNERQLRLERAIRPFGRRTGWVRGYGRYVKAAGDRTVELLMDESNGVPVESNVVERGALRSHTTFAYDRAFDGTLVRRGVRLERAASPDEPASERSDLRGARRVTEIRYADLQLTKGGR